MPTRLYVLLAIGVLMLIFLIYELVAKKAYGTWGKGRALKKGGVREMNSRWHIQSDDSSKYWNVVRSHTMIVMISLGYVISGLLR